MRLFLILFIILIQLPYSAFSSEEKITLSLKRNPPENPIFEGNVGIGVNFPNGIFFYQFYRNTFETKNFNTRFRPQLPAYFGDSVIVSGRPAGDFRTNLNIPIGFGAYLNKTWLISFQFNFFRATSLTRSLLLPNDTNNLNEYGADVESRFAAQNFALGVRKYSKNSKAFIGLYLQYSRFYNPLNTMKIDNEPINLNLGTAPDENYYGFMFEIGTRIPLSDQRFYVDILGNISQRNGRPDNMQYQFYSYGLESRIGFRF